MLTSSKCASQWTPPPPAQQVANGFTETSQLPQSSTPNQPAASHSDPLMLASVDSLPKILAQLLLASGKMPLLLQLLIQLLIQSQLISPLSSPKSSAIQLLSNHQLLSGLCANRRSPPSALLFQNATGLKVKNLSQIMTSVHQKI